MFKHFSTPFGVYFVLKQTFITNPCSQKWGFSLLFLIISCIWHFKLQLQHAYNKHLFCFISWPFNRERYKVFALVKKTWLSNTVHQLPQFWLLCSPMAQFFLLEDKILMDMRSKDWYCHSSCKLHLSFQAIKSKLTEICIWTLYQSQHGCLCHKEKQN